MFAKADKNQLAGVFKYLDGCLEQIVKDNELGALKQALKVTYYLCPPLLRDMFRRVDTCPCASLLRALHACTRCLHMVQLVT